MENPSTASLPQARRSLPSQDRQYGPMLLVCRNAQSPVLAMLTPAMGPPKASVLPSAESAIPGTSPGALQTSFHVAPPSRLAMTRLATSASVRM
jgi:hypothetical protein